MIKIVTLSQLKNDINKYSNNEIEKLSGKECDDYIESLVLELFKGFRNGRIYNNDDIKDVSNVLTSFMNMTKKKFNNSDAVLLDRQYKFLLNAYFTSNITVVNGLFDLRLCILNSLIVELMNLKVELIELLFTYYHNYSNESLLNELFYKLSTDENLKLTFDIHDKYLNNPDFVYNKKLMKHLDSMIDNTVNSFFIIFDSLESLVNIDEVTDDNYFDDIVATIKTVLKDKLNNGTDFEKKSLINSGFENSLFHEIENTKSEIGYVKEYIKIKDWFLNLYDNNAFFEFSKSKFETLNKFNSDEFDNFDDFIKKEPKYDLQNIKLIIPDNNVAF